MNDLRSKSQAQQSTFNGVGRKWTLCCTEKTQRNVFLLVLHLSHGSLHNKPDSLLWFSSTFHTIKKAESTETETETSCISFYLTLLPTRFDAPWQNTSVQCFKADSVGNQIPVILGPNCGKSNIEYLFENRCLQSWLLGEDSVKSFID